MAPQAPLDLPANLSVLVHLSLNPPAHKMVTHHMETCPRCCRCTAWLPAPAAPTAHSQGFQPVQGAQQWARAWGDSRATSTSLSLTLAWCLCAQPKVSRGLSAARAWGPRSRARPLPQVPACRCPAGEGGGWGSLRTLAPTPTASCRTNCQRGTELWASHGHTGRDLWGHKSHVCPRRHARSDTLLALHWCMGMHLVTLGNRDTWVPTVHWYVVNTHLSGGKKKKKE